MWPGPGGACHSAWTCYFGSLTFAKDFTGNWLNSGDRSRLGRSLYCYRTGWGWNHRRGSRVDTANFLQFFDFRFNNRNDFFLFFPVFQENRKVEESLAGQAQFHQSGLHAGKDFRYLTFIYIADDALGAVPLNIKLNEFVVLQNGELGFLGCCRND